MDAREILKELENRKHVIISVVPNGSALQREVSGEDWKLHITNNPEEYLSKIKDRYIGKAIFQKSYPCASFEEAAEIVNDIYNHYHKENGKIEKDELLDINKPVYLAVHIHYITQIKTA